MHSHNHSGWLEVMRTAVSSGGGGGGGGGARKRGRGGDTTVLGQSSAAAAAGGGSDSGGGGSDPGTRAGTRDQNQHFGHYIDEKRKKLREQYATELNPVDLERLVRDNTSVTPASAAGGSSGGGGGGLFRNVCIHVNGYTKPAFPELRALVCTCQPFVPSHPLLLRLTSVMGVVIPSTSTDRFMQTAGVWNMYLYPVV